MPPKAHSRAPRARRKAAALLVHVDGVVIVVSTIAFCEICFGAGTGPYNSFRGMAAVARGLERRLPPASTSAATP
jgi:hypothetical protein